MKKLFAAIATLLCLTLILLVFPGCTRAGSSMNGSGTLMDQDVRMVDFTGVEIRGPFQADIVQSDAFQVIVNTDENLINRIQVSKDDANLMVNVKAPATFFPTSLKVKIGMPRIYKLVLSDGAAANLTGFKSTYNFSLSLDGQGALDGFIAAGNCDFLIADASQVNIQGSAFSLDLDSSGKSRLNLEEFAVKTARVTLKDNSEAILNLNGIVDVRLEDNSTIFYVGNPVFSDTFISGGSTMKHK